MSASCAHLEPGTSVVLGSIVNDPSTGNGWALGCEAMVIRAVGLADTVLTWPAVTRPSDDPLARDVWLEEAAGSLQIAGTDFVDAAPTAFTLPASNCPGLP